MERALLCAVLVACSFFFVFDPQPKRITYLFFLEPFLDLCVSSLREGHANLLCIVPILTDVTYL